MGVIKNLKEIYKTKHDHYILVDYDFYKNWKFIIKILIHFNKRYIPCEIFRKKFKFHENIVIVGLKWSGKNVKRRTSGIAKDFIEKNENPTCIYCETALNLENATSDHIVPISSGGNNTQVNIVVCCKDCNNERGSMEFNRYLKKKNKKYIGKKDIFI